MFLKQNYFKAKEFEKEEGRKKKKVNFIPCDYVVNSCFALESRPVFFKSMVASMALLCFSFYMLPASTFQPLTLR